MNILEAAKLVQGAIVRHGTDGWADTGAGTVVVQSEEWEASEIVARYAALREDDTPVDAAWLERVGCVFNAEAGDYEVASVDGKSWLFVNAEHRRAAIKRSHGFCKIGSADVTRGHVRKLCDVLGIEREEEL